MVVSIEQIMMTNTNLVIPINSDVLNITTEKYAVNDSTDAYSNILHMNDINNVARFISIISIFH